MDLTIAVDVPLKFWPPVLLPGTWDTFFTAVGMLVPKTPVNENGFSPRNENNIGFTWEILTMQPVTVTQAKQHSTHGEFGYRIDRPDTAHVLAAAPG